MNFAVKKNFPVDTAVGLSVSTSDDHAALAWSASITVESTAGKHFTGLMRAAYLPSG